MGCRAIAVVVGVMCVWWGANGVALAEGVPESVAFARIVLDENGHSDFLDAEVPFEVKDFAPPAGPLGVAAMQSAESLVFTAADVA